jgi:hypothetical protein
MAWKVSRDEATAKVEALEAAAVAHAAALKAAEESAASKAIEIAAAAGVTAPLEIECGQNTPETKTMTREAFTALKPFEQAAYCKAGGKLTE